MKICILDWTTVSSGDIRPDVFSQFGEVNCFPLANDENAAQLIADAEIVLCNKVIISREVMKKCRNIRYIGLFATGFNNIDIKAASEFNITVCNAGEYSTNAVAQQTFAYILEYYSRIAEYDNFVKNGGWITSKTFSKFPFKTREITGKTLAVIGFGSIGRKTAKIADAFGMNVIVNTRTAPDNCPFELVSREDAFSRAEVLTIHCPLTEKTRNMVNRESLSLMKNGALLINTARGGIVNENDLAEALNADRICAALDVLEHEPMSETTPLKTAKNCIITPHTAWAPLETRLRLIDIVCQNISAWLDGKPQNIVN